MRGTHKRENRVYRFLYTITICLACLVTFQAKGLSQPGENVTLKANNVSLAEIFKTIYKQTRLKVSYSNTTFDDKEKISVNFNNTPVQDVMAFLLKDKEVNFLLSENLIIISGKKKDSSNAFPEDTLVNLIPTIIGKVTDSEGKPIPAATISVKGTSHGASTDEEGNFRLDKIKKNSTITVSSIGFESRQLIITGSTILVKLNVFVSELDETVVIAYGETSKRYSTGNIASVKAKDIEKQPVNNPLLALQGRVPGLLITQASGISGSGLTVRIQGQNSIGNGNDPLYVVDGVPISSNLPSTGSDGVLGDAFGGIIGVTPSFGNPLNFLNPLDIESIDILKDADATAIYGSRAANGAILITTKKGKSGKAKVDFSLQTGWGEVSRKIKMLNTREYLDMRYEAFKNDGINWTDPSVSANDLKLWDTTANIDWQKFLLGGTANYTNISASLSGGSPIVQYRIAGTYNNQSTVFPLPDEFSNKKASLSLNLSTNSANKRFHLRFTGNYMLDRNQLPRSDFTSTAIVTAPIAPKPFNEDGTLNWELDDNGNSTFLNPLSDIYRKYKSNTHNIISNLNISYELLDGLVIGSSLGATLTETKDFVPTPIVSIRPERRDIEQRSASYANRTLGSWVVEPQVSFERGFRNMRLEALVGATILQNDMKIGELIASGFASDDVLEDPASATFWSYGTSTISKYKYSAAFGRLNLRWTDKYILNISGRRDGSSRFGAKNRFHNFGALGLAWIISNEQFLRNHFSWISFAKIRGSYGTTGNDQIGDYSFLSTYQPIFGIDISYQGVAGIAPQKLPNENLQWEATRKLQIGLDLAFLKDRIMLNINYVDNRSSNQLVESRLPSYVGLSSILQNFPALVSNKSFEIYLNIEVAKNNRFSWSTNMNLTIPRNKLVAFPNLEGSQYANILVVGKPLHIEKTYHILGVNSTTGQYEFASKDGNPTGTPSYPDDYNIIVDMTPRLFGGIQNTITYKGISLDFLFQFTKHKGANFVYGNNSRATPGSFFRTGSNQPATVLERWRNPGDIAPIQKLTSEVNDPFVIAARSSDGRFTDASYIRLKNVSLTWQLPERILSKYRLNNWQLFLQAQNLLTITNYKGLDPETRSDNVLPPLRMATIGIRGSF